MRFDLIQKQVAAAQEDLEKLIVEPSLTLEKRWELWVDAPAFLKNISEDLFDLKQVSPLIYLEVKRQDFHRYQVVSMEVFEDNRSTMEEILKHNMCAVIYDW